MVSLRKVTKQDLPFLRKLLEENVESTKSEAEEWYLQVLSHKNKGEATNFIILLNKKRIGTIGYKKLNVNYRLLWFHISKKHQNKGFGSEALEQVIGKISKKRPCSIKVSTGYVKAIDFYKKHGFKIIGKVPNFYPSGNAKITLSLIESRKLKL